GHGKSYSVVENVILPAVKAGRRVYTNIPMQTHIWQTEIGAAPISFENSDILENENWFTEVFEPGAILVIDEAWDIWPAGQTIARASEQHKNFVQKHRHMVGPDGKSTDIVICAADLNLLATWIRSGVESTYRTTKHIALGQNKAYRMDIYAGGVTGQSPPKSKLIRQMNSTYKDEVTRLYKSQTLSEVDGHVQEIAIDGRGNLFKSW